MPQTKLAFLRYREIDSLIRDKQKPYPNRDEIMRVFEDKFGVFSVSTFEKDVKAMRDEFAAPIAFSRKFGGYFYKDPSYRFLSPTLTDAQKQALTFVEEWLHSFQHISLFETFSGAIERVLEGLEMTRQISPEKGDGNHVVISEANYYQRGQVLTDLLPYIQERTVINMVYQKFSSNESKEYEIHPYLLKEYEGLWYLVGYDEEAKKVKTFAVDRVKDYFRISNPYIPMSEVGFDPDAHYKHCIGVSVLSAKPEEILLRFTPFRGNYLKIHPIHHSQEVKEVSDSAVVISLRLLVNPELINKIIGYGADVEVLKPLVLRQQIKTLLTKALEVYN